MPAIYSIAKKVAKEHTLAKMVSETNRKLEVDRKCLQVVL